VKPVQIAPQPQGYGEHRPHFDQRNVERFRDRHHVQQEDGEVERIERPTQPRRDPRRPLILGGLLPPGAYLSPTGVAKHKDCWHFSNAATPLLRSTMFPAALLDTQLRLDHAPQQAGEMCHNLGVCRVFKWMPVNDGSGVSSKVYGGREGGVMGSLAAGGTQRCNLLPPEVENAATTTPKQPGRNP
jgi:hypothetical protein